MPITAEIIRLARASALTHGEWARADLSGVSWATLGQTRLVAAYFGGRAAERLYVQELGMGSRDGVWQDTGRDVSVGGWSIRPDLAAMIAAGQGEAALEQARREVAAAQAEEAREAVKAARADRHALIRDRVAEWREHNATSFFKRENPPRTGDLRADAVMARILRGEVATARAYEAARKAAAEPSVREARAAVVPAVKPSRREARAAVVPAVKPAPQAPKDSGPLTFNPFAGLTL